MRFSDLKFALVANTDWYLANFRHDLAKAITDQGADVHCIAPQGRYLDWLAKKGYHTHALDLGDDSFSLLGNRRLVNHLTHLYRQIQPDLTHHFTPRCVVAGSMSAGRSVKPKVVNALTGLGHVFTSGSLKSRLARPVLGRLFRRQLNGAGRVTVFQNQADMDELIEAGIVVRERCRLIRGSGVDPDRFVPRDQLRADNETRVLFASRLIGEKGVFELVEAMTRVVGKFPNAKFWVAGEPYAQNPTTLNQSDLDRLAELPWVRLLGHRDDMAEVLQEVDIVALPSWREGTPKILLEAASCGLPIAATDIPGCRGVVEHRASGLLVPVKDVDALAEAISELCADADLRRAMGLRGRVIILKGFTSDLVIRQTMEIYADLLSQPAGQ